MLLPDVGLYLLLAVWGGLVALDGTGLGQFMYSRPLVAATVAGLLSGSAVAGAAVGLVLEAFHLAVLPVGAARYPEAGPPAVVAGALFALSDHLPSTLLTVLVFFLAWERLAGRTVQLLRQFNVRLIAGTPGASMGATELERKHLAAVGVDLVRGMVLVAAGIPVLALLIQLSGSMWDLDQRVARAIVTAVFVGLVAGSARSFGGKMRLFGAGVVGGLLLTFALR